MRILALLIAIAMLSPTARADDHETARPSRTIDRDKPDNGGKPTPPPPPMSAATVIESRTWLGPCADFATGRSGRVRIRFGNGRLVMENVEYPTASCAGGPVGFGTVMRVDYAITEARSGKVWLTVPDLRLGEGKIQVLCELGSDGKLTMTDPRPDGYFNLTLVSE